MEEKPVFNATHVGPSPDWQELYNTNAVEVMPWYNPHLDEDLEMALRDRGLRTGTFLDLGTGPGTQAIELAKRGFTVTGVDLAESAIEKAKQLSSDVRWLAQDILRPTLQEAFHFIFDRGCFHVFDPADRATYVTNVTRLLHPGGTLFLKCFSVDQPPRPDGGGPKRFSHDDIRSIFGEHFEIDQIYDSVYQGTLNPYPKALFVVMRSKS